MNRTNFGANTDIMQIVLDILMLIGSFTADYIIFGNTFEKKSFLSLSVLVILFIMVYILSNKEEYLYNVTLFWYLDRIHRKVTKSFLLATIASLGILYYATNVGNEERKVFYIFLISSYMLLCIKMIVYRNICRKREKQSLPRIILVGDAEEFQTFYHYLMKTNMQLNMIGYVAMNETDVLNDERYVGCISDLEKVIRTYEVDQIYFMEKQNEDKETLKYYLDLCMDMGVTAKLCMNPYRGERAKSFVSMVGTYPVITYHTISLNNSEKMVKRLIDIIGGLTGIIMTAPIMIATAIAIKCDSNGPVLFKQVRVGQNGRQFKIYKFRSMYVDAEKRKAELMAQNELHTDLMFKMKDDPRITRVGKVIRKLSIDELPQFFNVLQGSMSLVGTRPPTLNEVRKYQRKQWRRISIKPGITGMWQVSGRSNINNFDAIVELDTEYIDNWTIGLDIKILLKTVWVIIKHEDAY